jgi:hypothetical protein
MQETIKSSFLSNRSAVLEKNTSKIFS